MVGVQYQIVWARRLALPVTLEGGPLLPQSLAWGFPYTENAEPQGQTVSSHHFDYILLVLNKLPLKFCLLCGNVTATPRESPVLSFVYVPAGIPQ